MRFLCLFSIIFLLPLSISSNNGCTSCDPSPFSHAMQKIKENQGDPNEESKTHVSNVQQNLILLNQLNLHTPSSSIMAPTITVNNGYTITALATSTTTPTLLPNLPMMSNQPSISADSFFADFGTSHSEISDDDLIMTGEDIDNDDDANTNESSDDDSDIDQNR